MASENVVRVLVRRHVTGTQRPFSAVLDGIYGASAADIGPLFREAGSGPVWSSHVALVCRPDEETKMANPAAGPARRTYDQGTRPAGARHAPVSAHT